MSSISRRTLLQRLGFGLTGVAGVLLPGAALLSRKEHPAAPEPAAAPADAFTLHGQNLHMSNPARLKGQLPQRGDVVSLYGDLTGTEGQVIGHFYAASFMSGEPTPMGARPSASMEMHTFVLPEGSLMGMGLGGAAGQYAIVSGTGRYAGARGSYTATQDPLELSGSGAAAFHFQLVR